MQHTAFTPGRLGSLELRNRVIKTATFEGMCPEGIPSQALIDHHRDLAEGGVGMTTVAYCAVSPDGRTFAKQMYLREPVLAPLRKLTDAVHSQGAAASLQLGHCGGFSRNTELIRRRPMGPSWMFNAYGIASGMLVSSPMRNRDITRTVDEFATAALTARELGFDAVELHLGHGYLLSQFLSPATNRRGDTYGGLLRDRLRFPLAVVEAVRRRVGPDMAVLAKINLADGFRNGLQIDDAIGVSRALEAAGIDGIVMSGGFTSRTPMYLFRGASPLRQMIEVEESRLQRMLLRIGGRQIIRAYPFEEMFFLDMARKVRRSVGANLILLGGVVSLENLDKAMQEGFEFVAMGRALIADPTLINDMQAGRASRTRCNACNQCVAEMDRGGVRCVLDDVRPSQQVAASP